MDKEQKKNATEQDVMRLIELTEKRMLSSKKLMKYGDIFRIREAKQFNQKQLLEIMIKMDKDETIISFESLKK